MDNSNPQKLKKGKTTQQPMEAILQKRPVGRPKKPVELLPDGTPKPKEKSVYKPKTKRKAIATVKHRETSEALNIHARFFKAIYLLIKSENLTSKYAFCKIYGINQGNFARLEAEPESHTLPAIYLHYLVSDYNISPNWLITGRGGMFLSSKEM
jgi:hypothetical protein